jgi:hypothetical protein
MRVARATTFASRMKVVPKYVKITFKHQQPLGGDSNRTSIGFKKLKKNIDENEVSAPVVEVESIAQYDTAKFTPVGGKRHQRDSSCYSQQSTGLERESCCLKRGRTECFSQPSALIKPFCTTSKLR